jgi:hypothetical protein
MGHDNQRQEQNYNKNLLSKHQRIARKAIPWKMDRSTAIHGKTQHRDLWVSRNQHRLGI